MRHFQSISMACIGALLALSPVAADAAALTIVNVGAPAINCVFKPSCTITVTDSVGNIPVPPGVITGIGRLQTRTFAGTPGSPGAGKTAYEYRVDMTQTASDGEVPCVTDLSVDFGPVAKLPYKAGSPTLYDVYVITQGGIGTIGLFNAEQTGNVIDFVFNQPVCAGATIGTGHSSYFIGLASVSPPHAVTAHVGWPGLDPLPVAARAPAHPVSIGPILGKHPPLHTPVTHVLTPVKPVKPH